MSPVWEEKGAHQGLDTGGEQGLAVPSLPDSSMGHQGVKGFKFEPSPPDRHEGEYVRKDRTSFI